MLMYTILLVSNLVVLVQGCPSPTVQKRHDYVVKESINLPRGWSYVGNVSPDHELVLSFGLKQNAFQELEKQLYEVSDPDHASYGNHLTVENVHSLVKPSEGTLETVQRWLRIKGIAAGRLGYSPFKDWINVKLSIADAEDLLDAKFARYQHQDGTEVVRALEYAIPAFLHDHIDTIQPTNSFHRPKRNGFHHILANIETQRLKTHVVQQTSAGGAVSPVFVACGDGDGTITPDCLRTLYGTLNYTIKSAQRNRLGINNFLGEVNLRSDAETFMTLYRPDTNAKAAAHSFKQVSVAGGTVQQALNASQIQEGTGLEGNLDIETVLGITYPTRITAYSTGGQPPFVPDLHTPTNTNEPYLAWLQYVSGVSDGDLPWVISTSYGDDEQSVPRDYANRVCQEFARLSARGVTLLFSSGDSGVGPDGQCFSNDGKKTREFIPSFPASCPFVTAVGATKIGDPNNTTQPEVAARNSYSNGVIYTSGGGFSNYFSRPWYQLHTISNYLTTLGSAQSGLFNPHGRAYPDLSTNGQGYLTIWNNQTIILDGTSASAPTAAGFFALINDALITEGRPRLGFLNIWLYKSGWRAFRDVIQGSNEGCGTDGFQAKKGWDAVTGWGTPWFESVLREARGKRVWPSKERE